MDFRTVYNSLYGNTVVGFRMGGLDQDGNPHQVRLSREAWESAIKNIQGERDGYATQEAYDRLLGIYMDAGHFMGWVE